ncbi:MAG TPA: hypothetical protein V6D27_01075 [Vampirovibrionales bacterium]
MKSLKLAAKKAKRANARQAKKQRPKPAKIDPINDIFSFIEEMANETGVLSKEAVEFKQKLIERDLRFFQKIVEWKQKHGRI